MPKSGSYVPAPQVPPEIKPLFEAVMAVQWGQCTATEAAKTVGLSRHRFQTLMHRGLTALIEALSPHPAGRPAKPEREQALEEENARLREENEWLTERVEATERLMGVVGQYLRGKGRPRRPRSAKTKSSSEDPEDSLSTARQIHALGLDANLSAAVIGRSAATVRRWAARQRAGRPLCQQRGPGPKAPGEAAVRDTAQRVRDLRGCIGADALRHSVHGISRRQAAAVKRRTLQAMDRERREEATQVLVAAPGIVRAFDAMDVPTLDDGKDYLLVASDACVPYRTSMAVVPSYDAAAVARALAEDFERHGPPLVLRADRAKMHDAPQVCEVLGAFQVLMLHGPAHHPCYYGQLERQNREHREWLEAVGRLSDDGLEAETVCMTTGLNDLKPRSTLGWKTAAEAWRGRPAIREDRQGLRDEVADRTARLLGKKEARGWAAGMAERLAIERALINRGYLRLERGGWCYRNSSPKWVH